MNPPLGPHYRLFFTESSTLSSGPFPAGSHYNLLQRGCGHAPRIVLTCILKVQLVQCNGMLTPWSFFTSPAQGVVEPLSL